MAAPDRRRRMPGDPDGRGRIRSGACVGGGGDQHLSGAGGDGVASRHVESLCYGGANAGGVGVPEGFAHSRLGVVAAARGFLGVEISDLMAQPEAYRVAWREMCTPEYFESTGRAEAESIITNQEANNHLISHAAAGQAVLERAIPLTAAVEAYADDRATGQVCHAKSLTPQRK